VRTVLAHTVEPGPADVIPESVACRGNRGKISREYTVWCATCSRKLQESAPNLAAARFRFREAGWRYTRKHGWRCRRCLHPVKKSESGALGAYGLRNCKRCGKEFVAHWPTSAYCPSCPTPGHTQAAG
jgi:hypothetical protein